MAERIRFPGLDRWLQWQQSLHPTTIELGLDRAARVLARTGWKRPAAPVITVGGTNGKGSCVALTTAMLEAGGYRVGSFTSPHLVDYRERIRVGDELVSEASLVVAFERIADALGPDSLTFFEFNTLAALLVFETASPDAVVLEVGMGGRLDAVNLVDADVAVVVSIALDHMEWLGPDIESIGREKAGIFRHGRPAIIGMRSPPRSVLQAADAVGADARVLGRDFDAVEHPDGCWDFTDAAGRLPMLPAPGLAGVAQVPNAAVSLAALRALHARLPVDRAAIEQGLQGVRLAGRFQRIVARAGFEWVLDVAHNPDAARVLAANLMRFRVPGRTIAVCGMLADKDVESVVEIVRDQIDSWIAAATDGPRSLGADELAGRARSCGVSMQAGGTVRDAIGLAQSMARPGDRVVVFGSFHTVGPALAEIRGSRTPGEQAAVCV
jgi:dihydrofolate synthase/folylpolyglutamate synthase